MIRAMSVFEVPVNGVPAAGPFRRVTAIMDSPTPRTLPEGLPDRVRRVVPGCRSGCESSGSSDLTFAPEGDSNLYPTRSAVGEFAIAA